MRANSLGRSALPAQFIIFFSNSPDSESLQITFWTFLRQANTRYLTQHELVGHCL